MNSKKNSHTSSLFHYTKTLDNLVSILKEGLRISYSAEQITKDYFVALPMVSFCDIPLDLSEEHRWKYGNYAIGFSKKALMDFAKGLICPVHYVIEDDPILGAWRYHETVVKNEAEDEAYFNKKKQSGAPEISVIGDGGDKYKGYPGFKNNKDDVAAAKRFSETDKARRYANYAIGMTKNYYCEYKDKIFCAYDECEWRIIIPEYGNLNGKKTKWFWDREEYEEWKKQNHGTLLYGWSYPIEPQNITCILVDTEEDKEQILNYLDSVNLQHLSNLIRTSKDKD